MASRSWPTSSCSGSRSSRTTAGGSHERNTRLGRALRAGPWHRTLDDARRRSPTLTPESR
ncbi:hypothetical protein ACFPRL_30065 [Pseudoclavibacter helvolus]